MQDAHHWHGSLRNRNIVKGHGVELRFIQHEA